MAPFQALKSREDGFSSLSQREFFDGLEGPVNSEGNVDNFASKRSKSADHAKSLLKMELFKRLHRLLETKVLYAVENGKHF